MVTFRTCISIKQVSIIRTHPTSRCRYKEGLVAGELGPCLSFLQ